MPENTELYRKFDVLRRDGKPPPDYYFVLDVLNDPHAQAALRCYRISCEGTLPELARALAELEEELSSGRRDGPRLNDLRTPR